MAGGPPPVPDPDPVEIFEIDLLDFDAKDLQEFLEGYQLFPRTVAAGTWQSPTWTAAEGNPTIRLFSIHINPTLDGRLDLALKDNGDGTIDIHVHRQDDYSILKMHNWFRAESVDALFQRIADLLLDATFQGQ